MIADAGFTVEGADTSAAGHAAGRPDLVHVRRRGAGTELPANT
jgi:biotin synthase